MAVAALKRQASSVAKRPLAARRPSCARSGSRSCSPPASAISNLRPEGMLAECVEQVIGELQRKGITFVPAYYLGDDDFWTADRAVSVNIPWYLANPELWRLVNDHLFEYTREEVLMYLRHEAGHAHQLRVRAVAAEATGRRPSATSGARTATSTTRTRGAATTSATCTARACTTTRRSTPTRTGPRRSRSGWRAARGGAATATGRSRWPSSSTSTAIVGIERACRGNPGNVRLGIARPVHGDQGDGRRLLRHQRRRSIRTCSSTATTCSRSSRAGRRARAPSPRAG